MFKFELPNELDYIFRQDDYEQILKKAYEEIYKNPALGATKRGRKERMRDKETGEEFKGFPKWIDDLCV